MGGLHKKIKKVRKYFEPHLLMAEKSFGKQKTDELFDAAHPIGTMAEQQYDATKAAEAAVKAQAEEPVMPIADDESLRRARRRSNQRRRNQGRASTILGSDAETLG